MRHGWCRIGKGLPSLEEQRATLAQHDVPPDRIGADDPVRRGRRAKDRVAGFDYQIKGIRQGDELAVAEPACLAATKGDVMLRLLAVCTKGGAIWDCATSERIEGEEAVRKFVDRADRGMARARIASARRVLAGSGRIGKITDTKRRAILKDWRNPNLTAAQIAEKHGVSRRLLFVRMGKRFPKEGAE